MEVLNFNKEKKFKNLIIFFLLLKLSFFFVKIKNGFLNYGKNLTFKNSS